MKNTKTNIPYSKKYLKNKLFFSILWMIFGPAMVVANPSNIFFYAIPLLAAAYTAVYLYENHRGYLQISNSQISAFTLPAKSYPLTELTEAYHFAGDLVLKFKTGELRIDTRHIEEKDLEKLTAQIERYMTSSIPNKSPNKSTSFSVK